MFLSEVKVLEAQSHISPVPLTSEFKLHPDEGKFIHFQVITLRKDDYTPI